MKLLFGRHSLADQGLERAEQMVLQIGDIRVGSRALKMFFSLVLIKLFKAIYI
jgi:hypothetical protein